MVYQADVNGTYECVCVCDAGYIVENFDTVGTMRSPNETVGGLPIESGKKIMDFPVWCPEYMIQFDFVLHDIPVGYQSLFRMTAGNQDWLTFFLFFVILMRGNEYKFRFMIIEPN